MEASQWTLSAGTFLSRTWQKLGKERKTFSEFSSFQPWVFVSSSKRESKWKSEREEVNDSKELQISFACRCIVCGLVLSHEQTEFSFASFLPSFLPTANEISITNEMITLIGSNSLKWNAKLTCDYYFTVKTKWKRKIFNCDIA